MTIKMDKNQLDTKLLYLLFYLQETYIILAVRLQNEIYADTKVLDRFSIKEVEERNVRYRKRTRIVAKCRAPYFRGLMLSSLRCRS